MAVRCSKCGEELLGPVNRCWKCGQQFTAQAETGGLPPVRYAPIELPSDVVMAEFAGGPVTATAPGQESAAATSHASHSSGVPTPANASSQGPIGNRVRTGSPFVRGAVMQPVTTAAFPRNPLAPGISPRIPGPPVHDPLAVAGAITAILMGIFALGIAWIASWIAISAAVVIALIGFAMGIWGLYSKRRGWALFGILISVAAIGLATYTGAILVYELRREQQETNEVEPDLGP
ncbi:MAG: hypothetical protein ACR2FY_10190 [Pirellulaceae bacterium]